MVSTAAGVRADLEALRDPERAAFIAPYFGIAPGGYGEGDVLLGMPVPDQRRVARAHRDAPLDACVELLSSEVHEHRLVRAGEFSQTLHAAERLLGDTHDLMHKATGWMLREVGKRDAGALRGFLAAHAGRCRAPRSATRSSAYRGRSAADG